MTNDIPNIKKANVILIIGSDTSAAHPVIGARIKQAVKFHKTKLIVIDPKKIEIADCAKIYARQKCGSDVAVLNGLMHVIIKNEWYDKEYVDARCENFDELKSTVEEYTPEYAEKLCGIPAKTIEEIAELFGKAETASVFYAMGITQHTSGTDNVWSVANLQMLCGNLGKRGAGVNPLRGQSNVQGACDMGALNGVFPGYQKVVDEAAVEKFEKAWNCNLSCVPGLTATEMVDGCGTGDVKALYIMGENPMLSDPDLNHAEKALKNTEFLVVQDIFMTETAELADVILPATTFAEKDGCFTNTERRVQKVHKAVKPPGDAKDDWVIIQEIANKMSGTWNYSSTFDIQKEISELTPQYGGITWDTMEGNTLQWPCPTVGHPGTHYLHKGKFARGKGLMKGIKYREPAEVADKEYPLTLTTGRVLQQFHTGTMSRKTEGLNNLAGPMVMISVADAEVLGIENSEKVKIASRRGEIEAPAFVTKRIGQGTIYIPFHYKEAAANVLTNSALDPVAKIPEFKTCAVKVTKL